MNEKQQLCVHILAICRTFSVLTECNRKIVIFYSLLTSNFYVLLTTGMHLCSSHNRRAITLYITMYFQVSNKVAVCLRPSYRPPLTPQNRQEESGVGRFATRRTVASGAPRTCLSVADHAVRTETTLWAVCRRNSLLAPGFSPTSAFASRPRRETQSHRGHHDMRGGLISRALTIADRCHVDPPPPPHCHCTEVSENSRHIQLNEELRIFRLVVDLMTYHISVSFFAL